MSKRRGWPAALLGAALLAPPAPGAAAQPPPEPLPPPPKAAPPARADGPSPADVLKAADEYARKLAGTDDDFYREILDGVLRDWLQREYSRGETRPRLRSVRGI